jgi:hypothetical protein
MTAEEIQEILAGVVARRGAPPQRIRSDNGPEFAAEAVRRYLEASGSGALSVAPASPWQNGFAESFHSKLRDEFLELEEFESVPQAQASAALWKEEYNTRRPHSSLGYLTPAEFSATCERYLPIEEDRDDPPSTEQMNGIFPLCLDQKMGSRPGRSRWPSGSATPSPARTGPIAR